ncbi:hypothetical protein I3760_16G074100 [Carya illinoinensis]|nr:hypothetical protein I3760_16G074100 [Carya illinoinensis]
MNILQNKKRWQQLKSYDPSDVVATSSEEGFIGASKKSNFYGRYSAASIDGDGERNSNANIVDSKTKELSYTVNPMGQHLGSWSSQLENFDNSESIEGLSTRLDVNGLMKSYLLGFSEALGHSNEALTATELDLNQYKPKALDIIPMPNARPNIPQILHLYFNQILTVAKHALIVSDCKGEIKEK